MTNFRAFRESTFHAFSESTLHARQSFVSSESVFWQVSSVVSGYRDGAPTAGNLAWSSDAGPWTTARVLQWDAANGRWYVGGDRSSGYSVWYIDDDGTTVNTFYDTGANVYDIYVDASGNVFICGDYNGSANLWKVNSSGTLQWSYNANAFNMRCLGQDSSGNSYVSGDNFSLLGKHFHKVNSSGSKVWDALPQITNGYDIVVLNDGTSYLSGIPYVEKWTSGGSRSWQYFSGVPGAAGLSLSVNTSEQIWVSWGGDNTLDKLSSSGSVIDTLAPDASTDPYQVMVDEADNLYVADSGVGVAWKYTDGKTELWSGGTDQIMALKAYAV